MRLFFIASDVPAAGGKGYQVRLYHQIQELSERHEVHLLAFTQRGATMPVDMVERVTAHVTEWDPYATPRVLWWALRYPASVALFQSVELASALRQILERTTFDVVHVQLLRMAPYVGEIRGVPTVLDLMDASALNMAERSRLARPPLRQLLSLESQRLQRYERTAAATASLAIFISERDRAEVGLAENARVNPNGVSVVGREPDLSRPRKGSIVFTGTMSYPPNAEAAAWFATRVLPLVRAKSERASLRIVGRNPGVKVMRLASLPGVFVTGEVQSVDEEIRLASVAVCPVRYGSGLQTKILEAMTAGTPVVASSKSVGGLPVNLRQHVLVADDESEFANAVVTLLQSPELGRLRARDAFAEVTRAHTWKRSVEQLEAIYSEALSRGRAGR